MQHVANARNQRGCTAIFQSVTIQLNRPVEPWSTCQDRAQTEHVNVLFADIEHVVVYDHGVSHQVTDTHIDQQRIRAHALAVLKQVQVLEHGRRHSVHNHQPERALFRAENLSELRVDRTGQRRTVSRTTNLDLVRSEPYVGVSDDTLKHADEDFLPLVLPVFRVRTHDVPKRVVPNQFRHKVAFTPRFSASIRHE